MQYDSVLTRKFCAINRIKMLFTINTLNISTILDPKEVFKQSVLQRLLNCILRYFCTKTDADLLYTYNVTSHVTICVEIY